jgi:hypothetical protein
MSEEAVNFVVIFAAVVAALIWWLTRDTRHRRGSGSSDHFSPRDPAKQIPPDDR